LKVTEAKYILKIQTVHSLSCSDGKCKTVFTGKIRIFPLTVSDKQNAMIDGMDGSLIVNFK